MSVISDKEFLRLLQMDVDYFAQAVNRFEELVPRVCASLQDQWRLQAQSRRNFTFELQILMQKAEECVKTSLALEKN